MSDQQQVTRAARPPGSLIWVVLALGLVGIGAGAAVFLWGQAGDSSDNGGTGPEGVQRVPGPAPPAEDGPAWFSDVTGSSGVDFTYRNGEEADQYTMPETLGGGVALLDYDGDGLLDVFLTGGGTFGGPQKKDMAGLPCMLFKNLGGFKFRDVSAGAGLAGPWWYTHGAAVADYDRDGRPDLLVTGYGKLALYRNEGGKFRDVTAEVGIKDASWSTSAGWGDLDGDGWPDLYVCHYLDWSWDNHPVCPSHQLGKKRDNCPPRWFNPLAHSLYRNEKGARFRDDSKAQGFKAAGNGLGVVLADVNDDGRPDVYVANDVTNNFLFVNRGGTLEEKGVAAGVALDDFGRPNGSMGVDAADYDGSGRASLFVTNFEREAHALYRNLGKEVFYFQSRAAGIAAIGQNFVGFGARFVDADGDGWEDLVIANGHVFRHPGAGSPKQCPVLLRNVERDKRRFFRDASGRGGPYFRTPALGRGLAVGDLDNDGRPDLVVSNTNSPAGVLRNVAGGEAPPAWLGVRLAGRGGRDVVGSTVTLEAGGRRLTRFAKGGGSYLSASDPRLLFGLGAGGKPGRLTVRWSWGETQTWDGLEANAYWELREGEKEARRLPAAAGTK